MEIYFDPDHDANDGKEWSDLKLELENGGSVESAARFLAARERSRMYGKRRKSLT
jgi:hypothetical protein